MAYPILSATDEIELLAKLQDKCSQGFEVLRREPSWNRIQEAIDAINGEHRFTRSKTLSSAYTNRLRYINNNLSALLTDVRPIWSYDSYNEAVHKHGEVLNKCSRFWWKNRKTDRVLKSVLSFAGVGASGYLLLTWNKDLQDLEPIALDPRDVVPISPIVSDSIQDWEGVCIRQRLSLEQARRLYPDKEHFLTEDQAGNSWFDMEQPREGGNIRTLVTSFWDAVGRRKTRKALPGVEVMRIYLKDDSLNEGAEDVFVGEPGTNWSYSVKPGEKLYPRGKLVVCTPDTIIKVLPNPYWHGQFPVVKFTLMSTGWNLLGVSIIQDLLSLQYSLNESVRGMDDARDKILRPSVTADRKAISEQNLKKIDSRQAGGHFHVDTTLTGNEGFRFSDPPEIPNYYIQYIEWLKQEMDELSGVKNIQQFAQLKQMPSSDTIQQFMEALSPTLKDMARSLEVSITEMADMMKYNFLQYYDSETRKQILGQEGLVLDDDVSADPGNMIPDMPLDEPLERRATRLARNFHFVVDQNSFLGISNMNDRMLKFQAFKANCLDPYTLLQSLGVKEIGQPPAENVFERMVYYKKLGLLPGPPPEVVAAQTQAALAQAQMAIAQMGMAMSAPTNGQPPGGAPPPPEGGAPPVNGVGPQGGRPSSDAEPPKLASKDGGSRSTISTSG